MYKNSSKYKQATSLNLVTAFFDVVKKQKNSKIDQHLARHFKYNGGCLSSPPPFLCSQIITTFSH